MLIIERVGKCRGKKRGSRTLLCFLWRASGDYGKLVVRKLLRQPAIRSIPYSLM